MLLGPFPTDLVAEHSARMPPEGARGTFPLKASFVEGREVSFGALSHSGPLLTHIFWSALSMAYFCLAQNMPWSGHFLMDTPALAFLCLPTLTNYATILMSLGDLPKNNAIPNRTERTSHGYPSNHDPMLVIAGQNHWCCLGSDLGQNATCGVYVA